MSTESHSRSAPSTPPVNGYVLTAFDELLRPTHIWARDEVEQPVTLRERLRYGDDPDVNVTEPARNNLLGRAHEHFDEAGVVEYEAYDFKGNIREQVRTLISDDSIRDIFTFDEDSEIDWRIRPFVVDWEAGEGDAQVLDGREFRTSFQYDAFNRLWRLTYPENEVGVRKQLTASYSTLGRVVSMEVDGEKFVNHVAYNAHLERTLVVYGNGLMTRQAYDAQTNRKVRIRTERYRSEGDDTCAAVAPAHPLQDIGYEHDTVGNVVAWHDRTPDAGVGGTVLGIQALDRVFEFDPRYRLVAATGREFDESSPLSPWDTSPRGSDPTRTRLYRETYRYDPAGNIEELVHTERATRRFSYAGTSNRLTAVTSGDVVHQQRQDAAGNLVAVNGARRFDWDHQNRLRTFRNQPNADAPEPSEPSVYATYLYDAAGRRTKKLVRKQGGRFEVEINIGGYFEVHRDLDGTQNSTLSVIDGETRVATVPRAGDGAGTQDAVVGTAPRRRGSGPLGPRSFAAASAGSSRHVGAAGTQRRHRSPAGYEHGQLRVDASSDLAEKADDELPHHSGTLLRFGA